jgi:hypothetical protein
MVRRVSSLRGRISGRAPLLGLLVIALAASALTWSIVHAGEARGQLPLGQGTGQTPATVPVQHNPEPPLEATPRAVCGPVSNPLQGVDGRVPAAALSAPAAARGYTCNLSVVSHQGRSGGFKVLRYIDPHGHECAFYDTALLFPTNAVQLGGPSLGVAVLDVSDPAHPVQTATLTEPPMMSPHESLSLNTRRGLLAAVLGNPPPSPGSSRSTTPAPTAAIRSSIRPRWSPAATRATSRPTGTRSTRPGRRSNRSPRSTSPIRCTRTRSGRATSTRTG